MPSQKEQDDIRNQVRDRYGKVATAETEDCGCAPKSSCCGTSDAEQTSLVIGYSQEDVAGVPEGANLGLGCGNPQALAELKAGEVVLDLGSGAGFDCFLASKRVGSTGRVIGVDMTPAMVSKARAHAEKAESRNVEFRLGEIEALPVADASVDVILSNCVINLSPDKARVFREAFRALKPGGRLAVSDVVAFGEVPETVRNDEDLLCKCVAGASPIGEVEAMLKAAGFENVRVAPVEASKTFIEGWAPGKSLTDFIVSASITGSKPW